MRRPSARMEGRLEPLRSLGRVSLRSVGTITGALVALRADHARGFELDEVLQHGADRLADHLDAASPVPNASSSSERADWEKGRGRGHAVIRDVTGHPLVACLPGGRGVGARFGSTRLRADRRGVPRRRCLPRPQERAAHQCATTGMSS
jgi:hypothetical protein